MEKEIQLLQDKKGSLEKEVFDLLTKLQLTEEENKNLKKENKELKEEVDELKDYKKETSTAIKGLMDCFLEQHYQLKRKLFKDWLEKEEGLVDEYNSLLEWGTKQGITEKEIIEGIYSADDTEVFKKIEALQEVPSKK